VQVTRTGSVEEKVEHLQRLLKDAAEDQTRLFWERFDMSWIYHDSALEGIVYTAPELLAAVDTGVVSDTSLIPTYDEIRQHKAAIDLVRDLGEKKRAPIDLELLKKIYLELAPEEAEQKGKNIYRKDMPVHRVYFHDIAPPDKIAPAMIALIKWMREEKKTKTHPLRLAAKAHHTMLHISPYPKHSGKVARLLMNLILMRHGYPPAVIHATERQRYYDALKSSPNAVATLVHEALVTSVESAVRFFEDAEMKTTSPGKKRSA
jgi:Fic family protein